jgi:hypothetical protein
MDEGFDHFRGYAMLSHPDAPLAKHARCGDRILMLLLCGFSRLLDRSRQAISEKDKSRLDHPLPVLWRERLENAMHVRGCFGVREFCIVVSILALRQ